MSAQHTPGPWIAQHWPDGAVSVAEASTLGTVALLHETGLPGEPLANARLIAAAPEMLDALLDIVRRNEIQNWFNVDKARAAIAKATGGAA